MWVWGVGGWQGGNGGRKGNREGRRDREKIKTIQGIENYIIFRKIGKY